MAALAGIYREVLPFETNFTQIPNAWIRDNRLSLKAKGLLTYLLSHESGYMLTLERIARDTQDGRSAIRAASAELVSAGYLVTKQTREEDGRLGPLVWTIQDPTAFEKPTAVKPTADNRTTKEEKLKEEQLEENILAHFQEFWDLYPKKLARRGAFTAYRQALKRATTAEILAGVTQYQKDPNLPPMAFIPYGATWLNQDRWQDGPLPERIKSRQELDAEKETERLAKIEREREARKREELERQREREAWEALKAAGRAEPPKCEHGINLARCNKCLAKMTKQNKEGN